MNKKIAAIIGTATMMGGMTAGIVCAGPAGAVPSGCQGGWSPWGGGSYCDGQTYGDGSYDHCANVSVMGFGGMQCGRVCPPDPANPAIPRPFDGRPC